MYIAPHKARTLPDLGQSGHPVSSAFQIWSGSFTPLAFRTLRKLYTILSAFLYYKERLVKVATALMSKTKVRGGGGEIHTTSLSATN